MLDYRITRRRCLYGGSMAASLLTACSHNKLADNVAKILQLQPLELTSPSFEAAAFLPLEFTCDAGQSPPLRWSAPPAQTQSWLLLLESASKQPPKLHWLVYDLPVARRALPAAQPAQPFLTQGGLQARNDFGQYGYRAPCVQDGVSDYIFRLYALKNLLDLPPGVSLTELRAAFQPQILATASLPVRYAPPAAQSPQAPN
jgi:Raf kinase inhibitor-like YbhB/YbcL family protein